MVNIPTMKLKNCCLFCTEKLYLLSRGSAGAPLDLVKIRILILKDSGNIIEQFSMHFDEVLVSCTVLCCNSVGESSMAYSIRSSKNALQALYGTIYRE